MIVVSDTTPLNYLVLIDAVHILPALFDHVYAPTVVLGELRDTRAPEAVRRWAASPPAWLIAMNPAARLASTAALDAGEADAISLAKERGIADILIDEYRGRKVAATEGLFVLPTLALLERAGEDGLLDLPTAIRALQRTSYRIRAEMLEAALARDAARKRRGHP